MVAVVVHLLETRQRVLLCGGGQLLDGRVPLALALLRRLGLDLGRVFSPAGSVFGGRKLLVYVCLRGGLLAAWTQARLSGRHHGLHAWVPLHPLLLLLRRWLHRIVVIHAHSGRLVRTGHVGVHVGSLVGGPRLTGGSWNTVARIAIHHVAHH